MGFYKINKTSFENIPVETGTYPAAIKSWKEAVKKQWKKTEVEQENESEDTYPVIRFVITLPANEQGKTPIVVKDVAPFLSKVESTRSSALTDVIKTLLGKELCEQYQNKLASLAVEAEYDRLFKAMLDSLVGKACSVEVEVTETGFKKVKKLGAPIKGIASPTVAPVKQKALPQDDFSSYPDNTDTAPPISDEDIPF